MTRLLILAFALLTAARAQNPNTAIFPGGTLTDQHLPPAVNRAQTTLTQALDNSATSVTVADASRFPQWSVVTIDSEHVQITAKSGNTLTISRAFDGSSAAAHNNGATVTAYILAGHFNQLAAEVKALQAGDFGSRTIKAGNAEIGTRTLSQSSDSYAAPKTSGSEVLAGNGSGGFTNTGCTASGGVLTCPGGTTSGATPPTISGGTAGAFADAEGTLPTFAGAGIDGCYASSTAHGYLCSFNNGAFLPMLLGPATNPPTSTELGYVYGVTSGIQAQLNAKAASNASTTVNGQSCALGGSCTVTASAGTSVFREIAPAGINNSSTLTYDPTYYQLHPWHMYLGGTASQLVFEVKTADAGVNYSFALLGPNCAAGSSCTVLASTAPTAFATTGFKTLSFVQGSISVPVGFYYLAISAGGTALRLLTAVGPGSHAPGVLPNGGTACQGTSVRAAGDGSMPSSLALAGAGPGQACYILPWFALQ